MQNVPKVDPVSCPCGSCLDLCIGSFTGDLYSAGMRLYIDSFMISAYYDFIKANVGGEKFFQTTNKLQLLSIREAVDNCGEENCLAINM